MKTDKSGPSPKRQLYLTVTRHATDPCNKLIDSFLRARRRFVFYGTRTPGVSHFVSPIGNPAGIESLFRAVQPVSQTSSPQSTAVLIRLVRSILPALRSTSTAMILPSQQHIFAIKTGVSRSKTGVSQIARHSLDNCRTPAESPSLAALHKCFGRKPKRSLVGSLGFSNTGNRAPPDVERALLPVVQNR